MNLFWWKVSEIDQSLFYFNLTSQKIIDPEAFLKDTEKVDII